MRKLLVISLFACALAAPLAAQDQPQPAPYRSPSQHGTNYDPPPMPKPKVEEVPNKPPEEKPVFEWPTVDWGSRDTWVKLALLVGSILMARRAFNDMTD